MKDFAIILALTIAMVILAPCNTPAAQEETVNVDIEIERLIEEAKEGDGKKIVIVRKEERAAIPPKPLGMNVTLTFTVEGTGRAFSVTTATSAFMLSGHQISTNSERVEYEEGDEEEIEEEYDEEYDDEELEEEELDEGEFNQEDDLDDEEWEEEHEENSGATFTSSESTVNIDGKIQPEDNGTFFIRCAGSVAHDYEADEELEGYAERAATSSVLNFESSVMMRSGEKKTLVTQGNLRLVLQITTDEP